MPWSMHCSHTSFNKSSLIISYSLQILYTQCPTKSALKYLILQFSSELDKTKSEVIWAEKATKPKSQGLNFGPAVL